MSGLWFAAVGVVVGLAIWLAACGSGGSSPEPKKLVDEQKLQACLDAAEPDVENWRVESTGPGPEPAGGDLATGVIRVNWDRYDLAEVTVLPRSSDAAEIEARLADSENPVDVSANVVVGGSPPPPVRDAISGCSQKATVAVQSEAGEFEDCDVAPDGRNSDFSVRGMSCGEAARLARQYSMRSASCTSPTRNSLCAGFNICCAEFVDYYGNAERAVIYRTGI